MMIVEPCNQERAAWPDATRSYVESLEEHLGLHTNLKLKGCPWCEEPAEIVPTAHNKFSIRCTNDTCVVSPATKQSTQLKAILAWNRRNRSLELTADHCDYYEQELISLLKTKVTKHLRLAGHWSASYTSACEELGKIEELRELVKTYFEVNEISCECCTVSNCGECMVCLILEHTGDKDGDKK